MPPSVLQHPIFEPNFLNLEYFFNIILQWLHDLYIFLVNLQGGGNTALTLLPFLKNLGWILSGLFIAGIVYSLLGTRRVEKKEEEHLEEAHLSATEAATGAERNEQWERVLTLLDSPNESDWKLAILEADSMLGEMLTKMGYPGDTIGEQLKGIDVSDFTTISEAWNAHKVRNQIAHEGMSFAMTKRRAKEAIDSYEKVFKEFHFI